MYNGLFQVYCIKPDGIQKVNCTYGDMYQNIMCFSYTPYQVIGVSNIGVAPITQVTHVRNKNSKIQGRSLNVI